MGSEMCIRDSVDELKLLTQHQQCPSFVQTGLFKRAKLETNRDVSEEDSVDQVQVQQRKRKVSDVDELKLLTQHQQCPSFVQIGLFKRAKLEMNRDVSEEVAFEESVQEDAEEENVDQVQDTELQENDSVQLEELGSGFATDTSGRVRRFSHRLKGKSRKVYKF